MIYSFARIGAVVAMKVDDYYPAGKRWRVGLYEKGRKRHEMPAHHKLEAFIDEYLAAAEIREACKTPLFRSAIGKTDVLTDKPMNRVDAYRMARRRTADAGFKIKLGAKCSVRPASPRILRSAARSRTPRPWRRMMAWIERNDLITPAAGLNGRNGWMMFTRKGEQVF